MKRLLMMLMLTLCNQLSYAATPYEILGIAEGASQDAIKKAYRQRALNWHPDKYKNRTPEEKQAFLKLLALNASDQDIAQKVFQKITEAYNSLKEPSKSQGYSAETSDVQSFLDKCDFMLTFGEHFSAEYLKELTNLKAEVEKTQTVTHANKYTLNEIIGNFNAATNQTLPKENINYTQEVKDFIKKWAALAEKDSGMFAYERLNKLVEQVKKQNAVKKTEEEELINIQTYLAFNQELIDFIADYEKRQKSMNMPSQITEALNDLRKEIREKQGVSVEDINRFNSIKKDLGNYEKRATEQAAERAAEFVKQAQIIKDKPGIQEDSHIPEQLDRLISKVEGSHQVTKEDEQNLAKLIQDLEQDRKKYATSFLAQLQGYLSEALLAYAKPEINSLINTIRKNNAVTIADYKLLRTALANKTERQQRAKKEKEEYEQASNLTGLELTKKRFELSDERLLQERAKLAKMEQQLKEQEMPEQEPEQATELARREQLRKDAELAQQLQSKYGKAAAQQQRKEQEEVDVAIAKSLQEEEYKRYTQARNLPELTRAFTTLHRQLTGLTNLLRH